MILVLLILILQYLPDSASDVEVGSGRKTTQEDLVGSEITLTEIDEELEQDEFRQFLVTDVVVV
jgi:hypothetical protein